MKTRVLKNREAEVQKLVKDMIFLKGQIEKNLKDCHGCLTLGMIDEALKASKQVTADLQRINKLTRQIKQLTFQTEEKPDAPA